MIRELKRPEPLPSLKESAEELAKGIESGAITGCVILVTGPGGDDAPLFAEGGSFDIGRILFAFEHWKRYALEGR